MINSFFSSTENFQLDLIYSTRVCLVLNITSRHESQINIGSIKCK